MLNSCDQVCASLLIATTFVHAHQPCSSDVINAHTEGNSSPSKGNLLIGAIDPIYYIGGASRVVEAHHARYRQVAVLAVPSISATIVGTDTPVIVRSADSDVVAKDIG